MTALRFLFYGRMDYHDVILRFVYWIAIAVMVTALVRRLGVINYLEAIFIAFIWLAVNLLLDLFVMVSLVGTGIFNASSLWIGYVVMAIFVFAMHRKRHVAIRRGEWHDPHHHP